VQRLRGGVDGEKCTGARRATARLTRPNDRLAAQTANRTVHSMICALALAPRRYEPATVAHVPATRRSIAAEGAAA
jgi:hypothetical protein